MSLADTDQTAAPPPSDPPAARTPEQEGRRVLVLEAFALDQAMRTKYNFGESDVDIDAVDLADIPTAVLVELEGAFKGDYPEAFAAATAESDRRVAQAEADAVVHDEPAQVVTPAPEPAGTIGGLDTAPAGDATLPASTDLQTEAVADPAAGAPDGTGGSFNDPLPPVTDPSLTVTPPAVVVPDGPVAVELDGEPPVAVILPEAVIPLPTAPEPVTEAVTQPVTEPVTALPAGGDDPAADAPPATPAPEPVTALPVIPDDAGLAAMPVTDVKDLLVAHDLAANVSSHQQAIAVLKAARDKLAAAELELSAAVDALVTEEAACIRTVDHNGTTIPAAA